MTTIENYNNLVPFMNELEERGTRVDDFCDNSLGYGFYAEGKNNHYVQVNIWGPDMYVSLRKRNGHFRHDVGDIVIKEIECSSVENVKIKVLELLEFSKTQAMHYKVELTECEINYLIQTCANENIVEKLKKVFTK